jgi:predicted aldo/keto reductase-like oxidoreductase
MKQERIMKQITLGRTNLRVKKFGFGGIPIQRVDEEQAVDTVRYAVAQGIDFIDTSRAYTTSEKRIGLALKQTDRPVVLATKSKERTADGILSDVETSLKALQRDYIDLYQCHFVKEQEYPKIVSAGGALEGLQRAKEDGMIGHLGITAHSLDVLDRALEDELFDTIMVCYSFLEHEAEETLIPKALKKNIGVIAMKPLSGGVIEHPKPALKFALRQEEVLVICGVESKPLFDENWEIYLGDHALDEADEKIIMDIRNQYDKNFCRRCDYCQPCTEGIPIQAVLGVRSQVKRMGGGILTREPRASVFEKARNCSECGECMTRCPYNLPIPELIKENLQWVDGLLRAMRV